MLMLMPTYYTTLPSSTAVRSTDQWIMLPTVGRTCAQHEIHWTACHATSHVCQAVLASFVGRVDSTVHSYRDPSLQTMTTYATLC